MTANIDDNPSLKLIETIEELLDLIRKGEIVGLAYAAATEDRGVVTRVIAGDSSCHCLNSGLSILQHRLCQDIDDESEELVSPAEESRKKEEIEAAIADIAEETVLFNNTHEGKNAFHINAAEYLGCHFDGGFEVLDAEKQPEGGYEAVISYPLGTFSLRITKEQKILNIPISH